MSNAPRAIGIIMDGNRRWARERGLPTLEGHRAGAQKLFDVAAWAQEAGIEEVTLYAFSTENWSRDPEEVSYLMELFVDLFAKELERFAAAGARIRFIGERERASDAIRAAMEEAEARTKEGDKGTLVFAFSYGGRAEILAGVNRLLQEGREEVDEASFAASLWSAGLLDPDLILRTGGEQRLSNFLTWQSVYSELFFTDTKWPDLSKEAFSDILAQYGARERRRGK